MPSLTEAADNARELDGRPGDSGARCVDGSGHRMRVVGTVRPGERTRVDCDKPLRAVCVHDCGEVQFWRCDSYGCEHCGLLKQRRLSRLVDGGADLHLGNGRLGYFVTLTAPGESEHRRWVQGKPRGKREACQCHDHGLSDGLWNAQESACWNRLRTALTRSREVTFAGAVETQKRGMLHRHVLMFVDGPMTFGEVQKLALAAGYGCVVDVEPVRSAAKAARYISKYVTKASTDRAVVPWERLDYDTGEVTGKRATYRLWSSSRRWGITMREIKATQAAQARQRAMYLRELVHGLAEEADGSAAAPRSSDPPV